MTTFDQLAARFEMQDAAVPSIGGNRPVTLAQALAQVERCEQALDGARETARSLARSEGRSISNLFSKMDFIARSTGERWADEVRKEMRDEIEAAREAGVREGEARAAAANAGKTATLAAQIVLAGDRARGEKPMAPDTIEREPHKGKTINSALLAQQIIAAAKKARRPTGED